MTTSFASALHAETLGDALLEAYRKNPTLNAARAGQRAVDENVPQALSGWRPTVTAQGSAQAFDTYSNSALLGFSTTTGYQENLSIKLDQPVFRGFGTVERTAQAEATVKAGRQQVLATEQSVLLNAVNAYLNVIRDRQIVSFRRQNLSVLQGQSRATSERFKAGELTKTDTAQAEAGVAAAQAALQLAIASMQASEAAFAEYVGHAPGALASAPSAIPPKSLDEAYAIAHETNPNILAAANLSHAADHNIGAVKSAMLPQADIIGTYSLTGGQSVNNVGGIGTAFDSLNSTGSIQGVLTVPIYEQGLVSSQVRQAKQKASQSRIQVIDAVRQVRQAVASSWATYISARSSTASNAEAVSASQLAYEGVRQEYQVGSRSTIDVLNAEQTLLSAQIAQVSAQHDQILASYQLQAAIGHLTGDHLRLFPVYDLKENYHNVRNRWTGTDAHVLE